MNPSRPMRIAILTHSTNPRGGVVHALALGESLCALGHQAVVHAPALPGKTLFREARCETVLVPARPADASLHDLVTTRIEDYLRHFGEPAHRQFDVFHAHDGISGNALATLKQSGQIDAFCRTVHHVDAFADPRVAALQARSITAADRHFVVSKLWRAVLERDFGLAATIVGNGVDRSVFTPLRSGAEAMLRQRFGIGPGPVFLSVGGVEARKNTLRILQAFRQVKVIRPDAWLIIAGGASLLDHGDYQAAFGAEMSLDRLAARHVVLAGPMAQDEMPPLFRLADALVFPSLTEGFGLVALEAIACGTPVVTSHIAPFTEHFGDDDVAWCAPHDVGSIANAMASILEPGVRRRLAERREATLAPHDWLATAAAHERVYASLMEPVHA